MESVLFFPITVSYLNERKLRAVLEWIVPWDPLFISMSEDNLLYCLQPKLSYANTQTRHLMSA